MSEELIKLVKETHQVQITTSKFKDMLLVSGNGHQWTGVKIDLDIAVTLVLALSEYIKTESEKS